MRDLIHRFTWPCKCCLIPASKYLLNSELILPNRHTVHKLYGAPQPVELCTLIYVHHSIAGWSTIPDGVIQVGLDTSEDNLKHGETTAQTLPGKQVTFSCYVCLLKGKRLRLIKGRHLMVGTLMLYIQVKVIQWSIINVKLWLSNLITFNQTRNWWRKN